MGEGTAPKRRWLRRLAWTVGTCCTLLLVALVALRLYFSDSYFKARLQETVKTGLGRTLEIRSLNVSLLSGTVAVEGLRLVNADPAFKDPDTLRVSRATACAALWPLVFSRGTKIEGLTIELEKPEIIVERRRTGPVEVSNIDDLLSMLLSGPPGVWPKQTGLKALAATVAIRGGTVLYRDSDEQVGASRVKDLDVNAALSALGQPTQVKASFALATPGMEREGTASLDGRILWLQADGSINPAAFSGLACTVQLKGLDVAQVTRHLRMQASLLDGKYQGTLGQPFTGTLKLEAPTLAQARFTTDLETDGVVAIWENGKRVAGNLPGRVDLDVQGGWRNGTFEAGQSRGGLVLAATRAGLSAGSRLLDLQVSSAGATYAFTLNARMDDLFATDVGAVLGLKDRIGGLVEAKVDASRQPDGRMKAEGSFKTTQGYVMLGTARQPTAVDARFSANVLPDAQGRPETAEVTFKANADSFSVESIQPAKITSLNEPQKLAAEARLKLHVGGREFWKQFGPLLEVVNMRTPLEEELDAELLATGSAGKVEVQLDGTLQQQSATPAPLRLVAKAGYDGSALVDEPKGPYLIFDVRANSADKAISIQAEGTATRGKATQVVSVPKFQALGELTELTALNARFGAYVRLFLGPEYKVSGYIRQTATSQLAQKLAADGTVTSSDLDLTTDLNLVNFALSGPALFPNSPPLVWQEKEATLQLGMVLKQSGTAGTLSIQPAVLKASSLRLEGQLAEADLARLKAAAAPSATPAKLWLDALPFTRLAVAADPLALARLQSIGVLPSEPLAVGALALKAQYDPATHAVKIETLSFQDEPPIWSAKLSPADIDAVALAAAADRKPFSKAGLVAALPSLTLEATAQGEALRRLQERFSKAAEPLVLGEVSLRVQYDAKTRRGAVPELAFSGPHVVAKMTASDIDVPALAALADQPNATLAQWLQAAPPLTFEAAVKPDAIRRLQQLDVLPPDAALVGELSLRGTLDRQARLLRVEKLAIAAPAGNCAIAAVALNLDKLGAFLDSAKRDAAAAAQLLPDFQLDLKAGPLLFDSLRSRKLLPEDFVLSGTLNLKARYDQAADRLVVETADFARDAKANAPLVALSAAGEIAKVRALIAATPEDAVQLLAHADKGLNIKALTLGLFELNCFLKKRDIGGAFVDESLLGVYEPRGLMQFHDLALRPAGAPGVFDVAFSAETPIQYHPRPTPGQLVSPEAAAEVAGTWRFDAAAPLRVDINPGALAARGTLNLDAAGLRCIVDRRFFTYSKPAGTPCKLKFDVTVGGDRVLRAPSAELAGGPVGLFVADLVCNLGAQKPILTCAKLTLTGEPLPGTLSDLSLDMTRDFLHLQFYSESVDLAKIAALGLQLSPHTQLGGTLSKFRAQYDGTVSAFPGGLVASTGLNARLTGTAPAGNVSLAVTGELTADQNRVVSKSLQAALDHTPAGGAASSHTLQCALDVTSRIPNVGVLETAKKDGLPLLVKIANAQPVGPLDAVALADAGNALASALSSAPSGSSGDMSGIKQLRVELSASAPVVLAGGMEIRNVQLPSVVLDDLKLTITVAKANVYGDGAVTIHKEVLDLATNAHDGSLELANIDLKTVTTDPAAPRAKDAYEILGRLSGAGSIAGTGFTKAALKTWQGAINAKVDGLIAQKNDGKSSGISVTKIATGLGGAILGGKTGRAMQLYGDDFGLFLNKLEFEPLPLTISVEKGRANIARTSLVGKGRSAGLQLDFLGGVNLVTTDFAPQMTIWLAKLPEKTQQELRLQQLDPADKQTLLAEFEQGKFQPVVLTGNVRSPHTNADDVLSAFNKLDDRIEKLIQAKKARESGKQPADQQQPPPQQPAQPPPPEKKKDKFNPLDIFK